MGLPSEVEILELWVPVISGTCIDAICSSLSRNGLGKTILVPSTYYFVDGPHGPGHGSRSRTGVTGGDFRTQGSV